jgi:nucleotide-binding universal stress UspA family protein
MVALKTILVATDFSDASDAAVEFASALTEQSGGSLHVLTVIPNAASAPWGLFGDRFSLTGTLEEWRREAMPHLSALLAPAMQERLHTHFATRTGDPTTQILLYAAHHDVDLIVVGTHGHNAAARVLLGRVADRVARFAECPVLIARRAPHRMGVNAQAGASEALPIPPGS